MSPDDNPIEPAGPPSERRERSRAWIAVVIFVAGVVAVVTAAILFVLR
jgi:hypothetical protein